MSVELVNTFVELRERAWRAAWNMSGAAAESDPPVPLYKFAAQLRINRIEFLPLLSTAGIGPVDGGYVVYMNSRAPGASKVPTKCLQVTSKDFVHWTEPVEMEFGDDVVIATEVGQLIPEGSTGERSLTE
jgi:hypothetical protein